MTSLVATLDRIGIPDKRLFALPPQQLHHFALDATASWHPRLSELIHHADPYSFFSVAIRAGERVEPWQSGRVTLLGDAVHTMPPTGGIGAGTALQDAACLAAELLAADRGERH